MADVKQLLESGWIRCRVVVELVGKPREHVELTMKEYLGQLKKEEGIRVLEEEVAELKKVETGEESDEKIKELWSTYAEIEMMVQEFERLTAFCIQYMPASVEIVEPEHMQVDCRQFTRFFNDLQTQLHQLDMVAKEGKTEISFLRKNLHGLLKNYVMLLLRKQDLRAEQLSGLTGVSVPVIEDLMDTLIEKGQIVMEGEMYRVEEQ